MGSLDQIRRSLRMLEEAPVLAKPGWLPLDSGWPELDALAAEHRRILDAHRSVLQRSAAVRSGFEAEDAAAADAMRAAFRDGEAPPDVEVTPPDEREAMIRDAERQARAASEGLEEFLRQAAQTLNEHGEAWLDDITAADRAAQAKREEAAALLRSAEADEMRLRIVRQWVTRNAGLHERNSFRSLPTRFAAWDDMATGYRPEAIRENVDINHPALAVPSAPTRKRLTPRSAAASPSRSTPPPRGTNPCVPQTTKPTARACCDRPSTPARSRPRASRSTAACTTTTRRRSTTC